MGAPNSRPPMSAAMGETPALGSVPGRSAAVVEVVLDLEELLGCPLASDADEDILVTVVGAAGSDLVTHGALSGRFGHVEIIAPCGASACEATHLAAEPE